MLWHKGHAPAFNGDRKKGPRPTQLDTSTFLSTNVLPCLSSHVFTKSELQNKPLCNKITLFLLKVLLATTQGPSTRRRTAVLPQYCSNKNKRVGIGQGLSRVGICKSAGAYLVVNNAQRRNEKGGW